MVTDENARKMHCPLIDKACLGRNCMAWRFYEIKSGYCGAFDKPAVWLMSRAAISASEEPENQEENAA